MTRENDDDGAFEDFLWEIDVTRRRLTPGPQASGVLGDEMAPLDRVARRVQPQAAPVAPPRRSARPSRAARAPRVRRVRAARAPRFARPELTSPWHRFSRNVVVQAASGGVLVGGTAALVALALTR